MSESKLPFERCYHWYFCDHFEWVEGNSAKFGLVRVDENTRRREVKASRRFYSEVIRSGGVTRKIYDKFRDDDVVGVRFRTPFARGDDRRTLHHEGIREALNGLARIQFKSISLGENILHQFSFRLQSDLSYTAHNSTSFHSLRELCS